MERQLFKRIDGYLSPEEKEALSGLVESESGEVSIFDPVQRRQTIIKLLPTYKLHPIPDASTALLQELQDDQERLLEGINIGVCVQVPVGNVHIEELWYPMTIRAAASNALILSEFYRNMVICFREVDRD